LDVNETVGHHPPMPTACIALVGDRSPSVRAHARIPLLVDALRRRDDLVVDPYWVPSEAAHDGLDGFDGIWVLPGSPYRDRDGALAAVRTARERGIPFLGTCGGFQHAVLELARDVCGIAGAGHAEYGEPAAEAIIVALECSLVGHEGAIRYAPGSLMQRIMGVERSVERYHCSYGLDPRYAEVLAAHGVRFTAHDDDGAARALELDGHPFFVGTLFQPELAGDGTRAHPVIRAFAAAAAAAGLPAAALAEEVVG
jgi:CTP synthase (UTP-ammonia lyase)